MSETNRAAQVARPPGDAVLFLDKGVNSIYNLSIYKAFLVILQVKAMKKTVNTKGLDSEPERVGVR